MTNRQANVFVAAMCGAIVAYTGWAGYASYVRAHAPQPMAHERCYTRGTDWLCVSVRGLQMCVRTAEAFQCFNHPTTQRTRS